ncbi:unnamed protein product [Durusdinium trenchii]|uniref:Tetrapyrrole methylase domain-containing protein n=1 Tax=Durusdinium trenchii TaxID=1381693 RepID=A0ABP0I7N1_9DINO
MLFSYPASAASAACISSNWVFTISGARIPGTAPGGQSVTRAALRWSVLCSPWPGSASVADRHRLGPTGTAQVPCEVVPGITSALGAAASCQVPLTHRGFSTNHVHLCVGQSKAKTLPDMDWSEMAKRAMKQTAVFYMGLKLLDQISTTLRADGMMEAPCARHMAREEHRCIICMASDGWQYVALHLDEETAWRPRAVPYSEILASHTACGSCWAEWAKRQVARGKWPSCPMCQRRVEVEESYAEAKCKECLEVVLKRVKLTKSVSRPKCQWFKVFCGLFVVFSLWNLYWVTLQVALTLSSPGWVKELPPALRLVLCNDEVKAVLDLFTEDPVLKLSTSFLNDIIVEGCKQRPWWSPEPRKALSAAEKPREEL